MLLKFKLVPKRFLVIKQHSNLNWLECHNFYQRRGMGGKPSKEAVRAIRNADVAHRFDALMRRARAENWSPQRRARSSGG